MINSARDSNAFMKNTISIIIKAFTVYLCSIIIVLALGALLFAKLKSNINPMIYIPIIVLGGMLGYFLDKKLKSIFQILLLIAFSITAWAIGDMAIHSLNAAQILR